MLWSTTGRVLAAEDFRRSANRSESINQGDCSMRILVYGLGAALLGTVAFAQTSTGPSPGTETGTMRRPNAEAPGPASGSSDTSKGLSESTGLSREQSGT